MIMRRPIGVPTTVFVFVILSSALAGNTSTDPSKSRLRLLGASEFGELPDKYEAYEAGDSNCEWAYWTNDVHNMEAIHCRAGPGVYFQRSYMQVENLLPGWSAWVQKFKGTVEWMPESRDLSGAMGTVTVRNFTLYDRDYYHCAGYIASWGSFAGGKRNALVGYVCGDEASAPDDGLVTQLLRSLSLEGSFESLVGGQ